MMQHYHAFEYTGYSFEERVGAPDPESAAIGRIALNFAALEAQLAATLEYLLEGNEDWGDLLTETLSFEATLDLLEVQVRLLAPTQGFNTGDIDPVELFAELRTQCTHAATLRARVLAPMRAKAMITHIVRTSRGRQDGWRASSRPAPAAPEGQPGAGPAGPGLTEPDTLVEPGELLDVADFICMVTEDLREFFLPG
jgi:hypothetical protein